MFKHLTNLIPISLALPLVLGAVTFGQQALAQSTTGLRNPYIPGASVTPPDQAPDPGQAPPMGSPFWFGTPIGQPGGPLPPASQVFVPPTMPYDKPTVDAMVAPYWTPSAQNNPMDLGPLPGTTSGWMPPAADVNIIPTGGMPGDFAPRQRWQAQTTRDLGAPRAGGSTLTDFGQNMQQMAGQSGVTLSQSQDGPRPSFVWSASIGATTDRDPNLPGAQVTQDLYGNRQLFKGPTLRARMTEAPY
jgi:hypothetical protein